MTTASLPQQHPRIDKDSYLKRLTRRKGFYYLARPQSFGKTYVLSLLSAYFRQGTAANLFELDPLAYWYQTGLLTLKSAPRPMGNAVLQLPNRCAQTAFAALLKELEATP